MRLTHRLNSEDCLVRGGGRQPHVALGEDQATGLQVVDQLPGLASKIKMWCFDLKNCCVWKQSNSFKWELLGSRLNFPTFPNKNFKTVSSSFFSKIIPFRQDSHLSNSHLSGFDCNTRKNNVTRTKLSAVSMGQCETLIWNDWNGASNRSWALGELVTKNVIRSSGLPIC